VLLPDIALPFDDPELQDKTVADVLADPAQFEGETLADPLEGSEYGQGKARVMRRADGTMWIHSFAHGRTTYELKLDFSTVKAALEKTAKDNVVDVFVRLVLAGDLTVAEVEQLKHIAANRSDVGVRALAATLKSASIKRADIKARQERERHMAERRDPRPQLPEPPLDAEYGPQMKNLNNVIGRDKSAEPTTRNPNKVVAMAHKIRVPSLHTLTSTETNLDDNPDKPSSGPRAAHSEATE
jgi:hypothetical protein